MFKGYVNDKQYKAMCRQFPELLVDKFGKAILTISYMNAYLDVHYWVSDGNLSTVKFTIDISSDLLIDSEESSEYYNIMEYLIFDHDAISQEDVYWDVGSELRYSTVSPKVALQAYLLGDYKRVLRDNNYLSEVSANTVGILLNLMMLHRHFTDENKKRLHNLGFKDKVTTNGLGLVIKDKDTDKPIQFGEIFEKTDTNHYLTFESYLKTVLI